MKTGTKKVLQCICGHYVRTRKSTFTRLDLRFGATLVAIAVIALLIKAPIALLLIVLPVLLIPWAIILIAWYAKGHSFKCAHRWATIVVIGSLGGSWF